MFAEIGKTLPNGREMSVSISFYRIAPLELLFLFLFAIFLVAFAITRMAFAISLLLLVAIEGWRSPFSKWRSLFY